MKKLIMGLMATVFLLGSLATVFADSEVSGPINTQATYNAAGGTPPIIKAKWETTSGFVDDDLTKPWTQVTSPFVYLGTKPITYWVIATDNDGYDNLDSNAYVEVTHPDCSPKYQVQLEELQICEPGGNVNTANLNYALDALRAADAAELVTYNGFTEAEVEHELVKCSAKIYIGTEVIDYHQMCGEFDWQFRCTATEPPCTYEWVASNFYKGYKVDAYVFDKNGLKSPLLTNYFEYICQAGVEVDFTTLDFESVLFKTHKWIEGDNVFSSPKGPACKVATGCVAPTIRNIGNIPVRIQVEQDDMDFGYSGLSTSPDWNVKWDARLAENLVSVFDPYTPVTLDGVLGLCNTQQISFSIYVEKSVTPGLHTGEVEITPLPIANDFACWYPEE